MKKVVLILLIVVVVIVVGGIIGLFAVERYTGRPDFCGTKCHIMKPNYETWKKDKHSKKNVACIECHYAPGEKPTPKAKFRSLAQLFSYLAGSGGEVRKRAFIKDSSCTTSECHPKEKFVTKKIDYKKIYLTDYKGTLKPFIHKTHEEKTIEGQKLHCTSCHMHSDPNKHFDVPKESCFLCHFRKGKENEGRSKCSVCHEIPKKPIESKVAKEEKEEEKGDTEKRKPITHQSLEKAKVRCSHCHFEIVKGIELGVKKDPCVECHHDKAPEYIKKMEGKEGRKLMHDAHITKQTARCFHCHQGVEHKKRPYLDAAIENCATCHPEPHYYTKLLIAGEGGKDVKSIPGLMHDIRTGCLGCHTDDGHDAKGNKVKKGSPKECAACHTKKQEKMPQEWEKKITKALKEAKGLQKEAHEAIAKAKEKVANKTMKEALSMFNIAEHNIRLVEAGGGVHNQKYSLELLDNSIDKLERVLQLLAKEGK